MHQIQSEGPHRRTKHGHLLEPFGWAADRLTTIAFANPNFISELLIIDCPRVHLIALVLAHLRSEFIPDLGRLLTCGSVQEITEHFPEFDIDSLGRVLGLSFPSSVLRPESYRRLIMLLNEKNASSFLQNADYVSDTLISTLHGLPPPLRNSCVVNALDPIELEYGFSDGLHFLVSRGAAPSFEDLVSEIAKIAEEETLVSKIVELVELLPLPTEFPALQIQKARRIDSPAEIRALADVWNKDFAEYIAEVNASSCALYLWEDENFSTLCSVKRCERLGWFLSHLSCPHKKPLDYEQRAQIHSAFARAGFPHVHTVAAISAMVRSAEIWKDRSPCRSSVCQH